MAQIIRAARSRLRDGPSEERSLRPSDVPGTLLNVALLNLSSGDESLRLGAYNLVYELSSFFKWELAVSMLKATCASWSTHRIGPKLTVDGLNIPNNALAFTRALSSALAQAAPHLTLEFMREWTIGFGRADVSQKCAALHYVGPWLSNLEAFAKPSREREDIVETRKVVGEIIRGLVSLTVAERRVSCRLITERWADDQRLHLSIHQHVWSKIAGAHEALMEIVIQEVIHIAIDAGFGSEKAECAADVLVSMGGTVVRGRVIARLRKVHLHLCVIALNSRQIIARTYLKPSPTLMDNIAWPEISTLSRIVLALSFNPTSALDAQLFLPELLHIITLLLGSGPLLIRQTVYGLAVNVVQSLASSAATGGMDSGALQRLLMRLQSKEMHAHFGIVQHGTSFEVLKSDSDDALLNNVEEVARFLSEVLAAGATSMGKLAQLRTGTS
jgi:neurofibromin 1